MTSAFNSIEGGLSAILMKTVLSAIFMKTVMCATSAANEFQ
jgi:hypothetical protein